MPECEYPPCPNERSGQIRGIHIDGPEIKICDEHAAVIDRNNGNEDPDFWRWAVPMMDPRVG